MRKLEMRVCPVRKSPKAHGYWRERNRVEVPAQMESTMTPLGAFGLYAASFASQCDSAAAALLERSETGSSRVNSGAQRPLAIRVILPGIRITH